MKRVLICLFVCFLTLCSCSSNSVEPYHWIPPEKKIAQTYDIPPYDPSSGLTYEQYLTTLDVPIVVSLERNNNTAPLLDLSKFSIDVIRNYPHVIDVSLPTLLHWLDNFCGEQIIQFPKELIERNGIHRKDVQYAPMEKATLMIGQYQSALKEEQIGEGRKWTDMQECCVNRALYEKLLAYEKAEFTGLGDTITVTETLYQRGIMPETKEEGLHVKPVDKTVHEYTVIGIVEDEGEYANTDAYGFFHIYTSMDMVKNLVAKHDTQRPNYVDKAMYTVTQLMESLKSPGENYLEVYFRPAADPTKKELRLAEHRIIPEEEYLALFENAPANAGYTIEVTLDSGKGYAEFAEFMTAGTIPTARNAYESVYRQYEKSVASGAENPQLNMSPLLLELEAAGELDDWYYYRTVPLVLRPLRVAP